MGGDGHFPVIKFTFGPLSCHILVLTAWTLHATCIALPCSKLTWRGEDHAKTRLWKVTLIDGWKAFWMHLTIKTNNSNQSLLAPSHASQQSLQWGFWCAFQIYPARNVDSSPPAWLTYLAFRLAIFVCKFTRRARFASCASCHGSLDFSHAAQTMKAAKNCGSHTLTCWAPCCILLHIIRAYTVHSNFCLLNCSQIQKCSFCKTQKYHVGSETYICPHKVLCRHMGIVPPSQFGILIPTYHGTYHAHMRYILHHTVYK